MEKKTNAAKAAPKKNTFATRLQDKTKECEEWKKKYEDLGKVIKELSDQMEELDKQNARQHEEVVKVQMQHDNIKTLCDQKVEEMQGFINLSNELQSQCTNLTSENDQLKKVNASLCQNLWVRIGMSLGLVERPTLQSLSPDPSPEEGGRV